MDSSPPIALHQVLTQVQFELSPCSFSFTPKLVSNFVSAIVKLLVPSADCPVTVGFLPKSYSQLLESNLGRIIVLSAKPNANSLRHSWRNFV